MRQIILDTETTGIGEGHRIVEIGCLELIERKPTGRTFHVYLHPQRAIDPEAQRVHGISIEWLEEQKAPKFGQIVDEFRQFIAGAELVAHNAAFDIGMMDYEFSLLGQSKTTEICTVLDTLALARDLFPGSRHSLDALCKRFEIDNSHRKLHGALLDAEILVDVYLMLTGGQTALELVAEEETEAQDTVLDFADIALEGAELRVIKASAQELDAHEDFLKLLDKKSGQAIWRQDGQAVQ